MSDEARNRRAARTLAEARALLAAAPEPYTPPPRRVSEWRIPEREPEEPPPRGLDAQRNFDGGRRPETLHA
jgi:hypothetical protein